MGEEVIETGVDELLALLKKTSRISITDAAKELKITASVVQTWVDFLVEEKIIGVEYKFTKPYIYLNTQERKDGSEISEEDELSLNAFKEEFSKRASNNQIPEQSVNYFWKTHVFRILERKKTFFIQEAKKRSLMDPEGLWKRYKERALNMNQ